MMESAEADTRVEKRPPVFWRVLFHALGVRLPQPYRGWALREIDRQGWPLRQVARLVIVFGATLGAVWGATRLVLGWRSSPSYLVGVALGAAVALVAWGAVAVVNPQVLRRPAQRHQLKGYRGMKRQQVAILIMLFVVALGLGVPAFIDAVQEDPRPQPEDVPAISSASTVVAKTNDIFDARGTIAGLRAEALEARALGIDVTDSGPSTSPAVVSIEVVAGDTLEMAVLSDSGWCFLRRTRFERVGGVSELSFHRELEAADCDPRHFDRRDFIQSGARP